MKALIKPAPAPGLELTDVPDPTCGPDEVIIRVLRTGICGTDLHILNWDNWAANTLSAPLIPGHEFYGEVVEIGPQVCDVKVGDRVSGEGHIVCGTCRNCRAGRRQMCIRTLGLGLHRNGVFAEYLSLPASNVWVHSSEIAPELGAIFDPLGNAVHTALSFDLVGEDVLVTGAGPIGIMGAMVAQCVGARKVVITDINPTRLALARKMGIHHVVDASKEKLADVMRDEGMMEGFDVGLEMSGSAAAFRDMIDTMNNGGKIAILGIAPTGFEIDWNKVIFKMLHLKGIYGREMFETWYKMIALVQGPLDVTGLITHRIGIDDYKSGFDAMRSGNSGKVVMDW